MSRFYLRPIFEEKITNYTIFTYFRLYYLSNSYSFYLTLFQNLHEPSEYSRHMWLPYARE